MLCPVTAHRVLAFSGFGAAPSPTGMLPRPAGPGQPPTLAIAVHRPMVKRRRMAEGPRALEVLWKA
ncbi:MAG: hypothetical protein SFU83_04580 [Meiothermus sp.]|nr:hypothetical protein [Meiothermus sp.]